MKTRVTQAGAWGIAVIVGLIFFGIGIMMMFKVADHSSPADMPMSPDMEDNTGPMPGGDSSEPVMEPDTSGSLDKKKLYGPTREIVVQIIGAPFLKII